MSKYKSIAIDGPSGAGKSSIAKSLSQKLNFLYVDTGALYRAIAWFMIDNNISTLDNDLITQNLKNIHIELKYKNNTQYIFANNIDISNKIRSPQISIAASNVSSFKSVRDFLLYLQRDIAKQNNVIMDGRDIATVVLPNADIKIFLTASIEIRAHRRYNELISLNHIVSFDEVYKDIIKRDTADSTRKIAPLKKSDDAILVDSSNMSFNQTLECIFKIVKERLH